MAGVTEKLTSKFPFILMTLNSHMASGYPVGQCHPITLDFLKDIIFLMLTSLGFGMTIKDLLLDPFSLV